MDDDEALRKMRTGHGEEPRGPRRYPSYTQYGRDKRGGEFYDAPTRDRRQQSFPPPPPETYYNAGKEEEKDEESELVDFSDLKKFLMGEKRPGTEEEPLEAIVWDDDIPPEQRLPFFIRPFKPRVKALFTMQCISTVALMVVFVLNYLLNPEFFEKLDEVSRPINVVGNVWFLTILGFVAGFSLVIYSYMSAKAKKRLTLIVLILTFLVLFLPIGLIMITRNWDGVIWQIWVELQIIVKLILLFLVMSPIILGVLGVWLESRLSLFVSAALLLSVVVILDVFLIIFGRTPAKELWSASLIIFACCLFIFFEFGDSAIRFHQLYQDSVLLNDERTVQSQHIVRMCKRYLFFSVIFLGISLFLLLLIYNSNDIILWAVDSLEGVPTIGSYFKDVPYLEKTTNSLVMDTVYGSLISMGLVMFLLIFFGTALRNWYDISAWGKDRARSVGNAVQSLKQSPEEEEDFEQVIIRQQARKQKHKAGWKGKKHGKVVYAHKRKPGSGKGRSSSKRRRGKPSGRRRKPKGKPYKLKKVEVKTGRLDKKPQGKKRAGGKGKRRKKR